MNIKDSLRLLTHSSKGSSPNELSPKEQLPSESWRENAMKNSYSVGDFSSSPDSDSPLPKPDADASLSDEESDWRLSSLRKKTENDSAEDFLNASHEGNSPSEDSIQLRRKTENNIDWGTAKTQRGKHKAPRKTLAKAKKPRSAKKLSDLNENPKKKEEIDTIKHRFKGVQNEVENIKKELKKRGRKIPEDEARKTKMLRLKPPRAKSLKKLQAKPRIGFSEPTMRKLIGNLISILKVDRPEEILKAVQQAQCEAKTAGAHASFVGKLNRLIGRVSPNEGFRVLPTANQLYKWLRRLLQEYLLLKKQQEVYDKERRILSFVMENLRVGSTDEIPLALERVINK